jgi:hypothetical protein
MNKILTRNSLKLIFIFSVTCMIILLSACVPIHASGPHIASLQASTLYVYPQGKTELTCTATDTEGGNLTYSWVCNEGTFDGTGSKVTWKAPNQYGEFNIMVTVTDSQGNKDSSTVVITSVVNENPGTGCPYCRRK